MTDNIKGLIKEYQKLTPEDVDRQIELASEIRPVFHTLFNDSEFSKGISEIVASGQWVHLSNSEEEASDLILQYDELVDIDNQLCQGDLHHLLYLKSHENDDGGLCIQMYLAPTDLYEEWERRLDRAYNVSDQSLLNNVLPEVMILVGFVQDYAHDGLVTIWAGPF